MQSSVCQQTSSNSPIIIAIIAWQKGKKVDEYQFDRLVALERDLWFSLCNTIFLQQAPLSPFRERRDDSTGRPGHVTPRHLMSSFTKPITPQRSTSRDDHPEVRRRGPIKTEQSPLFNVMDWFISLRCIYCMSIKRACGHSVRRHSVYTAFSNGN